MKQRVVIAQSGGCTAVINASLVGAIKEARRKCPQASVFGAVHGIEGILAGRYVNLTGESPERLEALAKTPAAALGSCRYKLRPGEAERVARLLAGRGTTAFIYVGGNDSADTALQVHEASDGRGGGMAVIGVPKTIDNDLVVTDHTPGYGSAARYLACVVSNAGRDSESMRLDEPVKIIEVSGRNSGWLTCAGVLGKDDELDAPQFVWPPEVVFSGRRFIARVRQWLKKLGYCVVVVCETVRDRQGRPISAGRKRAQTDAFGHPRIAGAAEFLCDLVRDRLHVRARWEKMGTIGRTASAYVSHVDRSEARRAGAAGVRNALRGRSGYEVVLERREGGDYRCGMGLAPLREIANAEKRVPPSMFDRDRMLPTAEFVDYAVPLLGGSLPRYVRLTNERGRPRGRGRSGT